MPGRIPVSEIRKAPALRRLPRDQLNAFLDRCPLREFSAGQTLFEQGEAGGRAFLVLEGLVTVHQLEGETRIDLGSFEAFEWLGLTSVVDSGRRAATAVAEQGVRALEVDRNEILALVMGHPEAGMDLLGVLAGHVRAGHVLLERDMAPRSGPVGTEALRVQAADADPIDAFIGSSDGARRVRSASSAAAASAAPVLLVGEAGTGKKLLARCIHAASDRASRPFVSLNCGLFSDTILESKLFGHARGALPGSMEDEPGAVEAAEGGSLLLEDVGDMPRSLQGVVLRFIELGTFHRLGETEMRHGDVRIFATTDLDLEAAQHEGRIRSDFRGRLDTIHIEIPPLRDRREDVPLLVSHLMHGIAGRLEVEPLRVAPSVLGVLSRSFPGNVGDLASEVQRWLVTLEPGSTVGLFDLAPRFVSGDPAALGNYSEAVRAFKSQIISSAILEAGGDRAAAAERLGLHRSNLSRMIRDLELEDLV